MSKMLSNQKIINELDKITTDYIKTRPKMTFKPFVSNKAERDYNLGDHRGGFKSLGQHPYPGSRSTTLHPDPVFGGARFKTMADFNNRVSNYGGALMSQNMPLTGGEHSDSDYLSDSDYSSSDYSSSDSDSDSDYETDSESDYDSDYEGGDIYEDYVKPVAKGVYEIGKEIVVPVGKEILKEAILGLMMGAGINMEGGLSGTKQEFLHILKTMYPNIDFKKKNKAELKEEILKAISSSQNEKDDLKREKAKQKLQKMVLKNIKQMDKSDKYYKKESDFYNKKQQKELKENEKLLNLYRPKEEKVKKPRAKAPSRAKAPKPKGPAKPRGRPANLQKKELKRLKQMDKADKKLKKEADMLLKQQRKQARENKELLKKFKPKAPRKPRKVNPNRPKTKAQLNAERVASDKAQRDRDKIRKKQKQIDNARARIRVRIMNMEDKIKNATRQSTKDKYQINLNGLLNDLKMFDLKYKDYFEPISNIIVKKQEPEEVYEEDFEDYDSDDDFLKSITGPEVKSGGKIKKILRSKRGEKVRGDIVAEIMRKKKLSLPQASKYVKDHGLY
jgi:hypothetical protein